MRVFSWKNVAHIIFNFELRPPAGCWRLPPLRLLIVHSKLQATSEGSKCTQVRRKVHAAVRKERKKQQIFRQLVKCFNLRNIQMISGKLVNKDIKAHRIGSDRSRGPEGPKGKPALMALERESRRAGEGSGGMHRTGD